MTRKWIIIGSIVVISIVIGIMSFISYYDTFHSTHLPDFQPSGTTPTTGRHFTIQLDESESVSQGP